MKRYVFAFLTLLMFTTNVNAESPTDKGVYSLSGSISYSHIKGVDNEVHDDYDINTFSLSPKFFYFVCQNIALGTSILYSKSSWGSLDSESYGIGPVARYYFGKETIYPFFSLEYTYVKGETTGGSTSFESDSEEFSIGFGMDYFISKNVALEPMVSYIFREVDFDTSSFLDNDQEELLIGIGINVFIF